MPTSPPADSAYFGRRLRDHHTGAFSEDDAAIDALLERLMSVDWPADRPDLL